MTTAFQNVEKAREIGIGIDVRIDQRIAHAGLRREMHDLAKAMGGEQVGHGLAIGNVQLFELEVRKDLELLHAPLFQSGVVVGVEIVDTQHVAPVGQQAARDVHSDKAGSAGDKDRICQDGSSLARRRCRSLQCRGATPRKRRAEARFESS